MSFPSCPGRGGVAGRDSGFSAVIDGGDDIGRSVFAATEALFPSPGWGGGKTFGIGSSPPGAVASAAGAAGTGRP
ncbi:MAG: hypothetical protein P8010_10710 [Desulfosarcinaceae bacterium]